MVKSIALACCGILGLTMTNWASDSPNSRSFELEYSVTVSALQPGNRVRVWLPVPPSDEHQTVRVLSQNYPVKTQVAAEPKYGNQVLFFETTVPDQRTLQFGSHYAVTRREVRRKAHHSTPLTEADRALFLAPSKMVPLNGKPLELLAGVALSKDPLVLARELYDRVDTHVRYDKSSPGYGEGDVLWVCDSRFGNCTDFHSLFLSLARSQGLPARFEIGFPLPEKRGSGTIPGYHCWAFFHEDSSGWVPVDISEADKNPELRDYYFGNLTPNRIAFSHGRDITLEPPQQAGPLNYFIYPHVEVQGRVIAAEQVKTTIRYRDLQAESEE